MFPETRLVGIARLAAAAETLARKERVVYRELPTRRFLTRCRSNRVPFDWTVNPYRGCEFGCAYCYARYTHEFMELRDPRQFETDIFAKQWSAAAFRQELSAVRPGQWIAIGTATDPYQPAERRYRLTRRLLETLAGERRLRISVTTKSDLVTRDIDVLSGIARNNILHVALTITTADPALARLLEPYAPRPGLRFQAVRRLSDAGLRVAVLVCPLMPLINDSEESLERLAALAREHGAASFAGGVVFLKPCTHEVFFSLLDRSFPHLAGRYRAHFRRHAFLTGAYPDRIAARLERARGRHGLDRRFPDYQPAEWAAEEQLSLPFSEPDGPAVDFSSKSTCQDYPLSL